MTNILKYLTIITQIANVIDIYAKKSADDTVPFVLTPSDKGKKFKITIERVK